MGYKPIYDGSFDVSLDEGFTLEDLVLSIVSRGMFITKYVKIGPGGGNPNVTMRGTKTQFVRWYKEVYELDNLDPNIDPNDETAVWAFIVTDCGIFENVA